MSSTEALSLPPITPIQWAKFDMYLKKCSEQIGSRKNQSPFTVMHGNSPACRAFILESIVAMPSSKSESSITVSQTGKEIIGFLRNILIETMFSPDCIPVKTNDELSQFVRAQCASSVQAKRIFEEKLYVAVINRLKSLLKSASDENEASEEESLNAVKLNKKQETALEILGIYTDPIDTIITVPFLLHVGYLFGCTQHSKNSTQKLFLMNCFCSTLLNCILQNNDDFFGSLQSALHDGEDDDEESEGDEAKAEDSSTLDQDRNGSKKTNLRILKVCVFKMWAETCKCSKSCNWQILLGDTLKEAIHFYNRHCAQWDCAPFQLTDASFEAIHKTADRSWRKSLPSLVKDIVFPLNGEEPTCKPPSDDLVRDLAMKQNMNKIRFQWEQYFTAMILHVRAQSKARGHRETSITTQTQPQIQTQIQTQLNKRKHDDSAIEKEDVIVPEILDNVDQTANDRQLPKRPRVTPALDFSTVDPGQNELLRSLELVKRHAAMVDNDEEDEDEEDFVMVVSLLNFMNLWMARMHQQASAYQEQMRYHVEMTDLLGQLMRNFEASNRSRRARSQPKPDRNAKVSNSKADDDEDEDDV